MSTDNQLSPVRFIHNPNAWLVKHDDFISKDRLRLKTNSKFYEQTNILSQLHHNLHLLHR